LSTTQILEERAVKRARRARVGRWFGVAFSIIVAVLTTVFTVTGSLDLLRDQQNQTAYDKAPYCAAGATTMNDCVLRTTATVGWVEAKKNTGKNAHGYTTTAELEPDVGNDQTVTLSKTEKLTSDVSFGDRVAVLVWRDEITRYTTLGKTHNADMNPHHLVAMDLVQVSLCLIPAVAFGRPLLRWALRRRIAINLPRNRVPDWTMVVLTVVTAVAAILRASYVVAFCGLAGIVVLLGSVLWPFLPFVARPPVGPGPHELGSAKKGSAKKGSAKTKGSPQKKA